MRGLMKIVLAGLVIGLVIVGGCTALIGLVANFVTSKSGTHSPAMAA